MEPHLRPCGDDAGRAPDGAIDDVPLQVAKPLLAVSAEDFRDRQIGLDFHFVIAVDERDIEMASQHPAA